MNASESFQVHDGYNDLTGSVIISNQPISVMAGSQDIIMNTSFPRGE